MRPLLIKPQGAISFGSRSVVVITSPCHGEDRGFESRRDRLPNGICSNILRDVKAKTLTLVIP